MTDNKLCRVYGCRFSDSHVTKGHLCGNCFKYGHGIYECTCETSKNKLVKFYTDQIPNNKQCTFGGCNFKELHTTEAHHCDICRGRTHSANTCQLLLNQKSIEIKCPVCKQNNIIKRDQQKVYGISELCVICIDAHANVFFPTCGHVCACSNCIKILQKGPLKDGYLYPYDENYLLEMKYNLDDIKIRLKEYPSYINIYNGLGTSTCVRRLNKDSQLECLLFSPDDIYNQNKMKTNNEFVNGYAYIETNIVHDE